MEAIETQVRRILCEILPVDGAMMILKNEDLEHMGMDSLNCIELIVKIEEAFDICIPNDKLGQDHVRNIEAICILVQDSL